MNIKSYLVFFLNIGAVIPMCFLPSIPDPPGCPGGPCWPSAPGGPGSPSAPSIPGSPSAPRGPCIPRGPCGPGGSGMQQFPGACIWAINWAFVVIKLPFSAVSWAFWAINMSTTFNLFSKSWIIASSCWSFASSSAFVTWKAKQFCPSDRRKTWHPTHISFLIQNSQLNLSQCRFLKKSHDLFWCQMSHEDCEFFEMTLLGMYVHTHPVDGQRSNN